MLHVAEPLLPLFFIKKRPLPPIFDFLFDFFAKQCMILLLLSTSNTPGPSLHVAKPLSHFFHQKAPTLGICHFYSHFSSVFEHQIHVLELVWTSSTPHDSQRRYISYPKKYQSALNYVLSLRHAKLSFYNNIQFHRMHQV